MLSPRPKALPHPHEWQNAILGNVVSRRIAAYRHSSDYSRDVAVFLVALLLGSLCSFWLAGSGWI